MIFSLVVAGFELNPSESAPLLFCMADAGIESTPFEREGRAMVTRGAGAGDVMLQRAGGVAAWNEVFWSVFSLYSLKLLKHVDL